MPIVEEVMTRGVISISEDSTVEEAMKMMVERHVSSLIVAKKSEADIDGIVTRKDVINKVIGHGKNPKNVKVSEIMTKPLMTVTKKMDVMHVSRLMARTEVRRFPVRECDKIVGIVSNSDIFRAYVLDNVKETK
ncbi:MAG: CBS domain-containing protein [Candidatus Altiarchaeota archaeon]|nr:CBS domain-containing protein [Candidatus Altiarchaeota archaeon]